MNIGSNILILRQAAGWKQKEFAVQIGVNASTLSLWETGQREPPVSMLLTIADTLGIPHSVLLVDFDEPPPGASGVQAHEWKYLQVLFSQTCAGLMVSRAGRK